MDWQFWLLLALVVLFISVLVLVGALARISKDGNTASEIEARRIENEAHKALEAALFGAVEGDQRSFKGAAE